MGFKYIFLDLDGTVTESAEGIINSVAYALEKLGKPVEDKSALRCFIGPPLTVSFHEFFGFDDETAALGVKYYREYYPEKGIFENRLYDGIAEMLEKLSKTDKKIILATSKPEPFAVRILEHYGVAQYFDLIAGSSFDGTRNDKTDVLKYAIEQLQIEDIIEAIMIGDRKHDIIGARDVGMQCAYVLFGYGSREEAEQYRADYIIENVKSLEAFLLDN